MQTHSLLRSISRSIFVASILVAGAVLSGCTTDALLTQMERAPLLQLPDSAGYATENRILVVGLDGNITTMNADGSNRFNLTSDASSRKQYVQPTWSPDGRVVAWTEIIAGDDDRVNRLVTVEPDGTALASAEVPFAPFYLFWSPDSSRLAYLSSWNRASLPSMALRVAEPVAGETTIPVRTLAEGQPFYFSWGPDGQQMVTHIGNERLELQTLAGEQLALAPSSGDFPAPQWSASGEQLVYAVEDEGIQRLVLTDLEGAVLTELTDFDNRITFSLNADAGRLAYVATDADVGLSTLGPLYVVDMATLATRELTTRPVLAFFWSPDGEKLAYITVDGIGSSIRLHWYVWDGKNTSDYGRFFPSRTFFQTYLPFFDQYAQSMRIWSPASDAFVYAGARDGNSGIWVQRLDETEPERVSRGSFAAWSPR